MYTGIHCIQYLGYLGEPKCKVGYTVSSIYQGYLGEPEYIVGYTVSSIYQEYLGEPECIVGYTVSSIRDIYENLNVQWDTLYLVSGISMRT